MKIENRLGDFRSYIALALIEDLTSDQESGQTTMEVLRQEIDRQIRRGPAKNSPDLVTEVQDLAKRLERIELLLIASLLKERPETLGRACALQKQARGGND